MFLERIEASGLAQNSYVLGSEGSAIVIDPRRDIDVYLDFVERRNTKLVAILETHIHADFLSGAKDLAEATGAPLYLSAHTAGELYQYTFPHTPIKDGDEVHAGDLRLVALHTPGHTPEHLSFLLFEKSRCGQPLALFSGDFVFAGSLGRPDLLGVDAKRSLAHQLYQSVHKRIETLPDGLLVYPGHGAGSLCGANLSDRPLTTLGYERSCNIFMTDQPEADFVDQILGTLPEFPAYYRRMKALNAAGPPSYRVVAGKASIEGEELTHLVADGAIVVDLRPAKDFGEAHIPGSINLAAGSSFGLWAPWVIDPDRDLILFSPDRWETDEARLALIRVGADNILGRIVSMDQWYAPAATLAQISPAELGTRTILDVRSPAEYKLRHIPGAISVPLGEIQTQAAHLPNHLAVICGGGYRSSLAASLLERAGKRDIANVVGGMAAYRVA